MSCSLGFAASHLARRSCIGSFLALLVLGGGTALWAQQPLFTFVQVSDSQPQTTAENQAFVDVLRTIAEAGQPGKLLPRPVDLVLFAGDITWGNTRSEWVAAKQKLDAWLTANNIPFLAVPGNHDVNPDRNSSSNTSLYKEFIADPGVWDAGSAAFTGQNGRSRSTSWQGLRFIGVNNSNPGWNQVSSSDVAAVTARVNAAAAAGENAFILCHHPHNDQGRTPLASTLPNPALVGYLHGHIGTPFVKKGLAGVSNPSVWEVNTNAIYHDRGLVYFEVFQTKLEAHVIILDNNPSSLPAAQVIPLAHPLTQTGSGTAPTAAFSASPLTGDAPLSVNFANQSSGATSFLWNFGDGQSSSASSPTHVYLAAGTYSVTLQATNAFGTSLASRANLITVTSSVPPPPEGTFLPVADARVNEASPSANAGTDVALRVKTQAGSSYQTFLRFDLGTLTGSVASAKLRLFCSDESNGGGSVYRISTNTWGETTITWSNKPALPTGALATMGAVALNAWNEIELGPAAVSSGLVSLAVAGGTTNSAIYSSREGAHPPELVLTFAGSGTAPTADFSGTPLSGSAPLTVAFTDASAGGPNAWSWDFGDGGSASVRNPTHVYTTPGVYSVRLTASNANGSNSLLRAGYVTVSATASVRTFTPAGDALVSEDNTTRNFGTDPTLRVRTQSNKEFQSFLRFDLSSLTGSVASAKLRLFCTDASNSGGRVYAAPTTWSETTINWVNKPALPPSSLVTLGGVALNQWVEIDVSSTVSGPGQVAFALAGGTNNSVFYSSREGGHAPELVITTAP